MTPTEPTTKSSIAEWWTPEYQRAADILDDPRYKGVTIRVTGQAGCGYHEPTDDPETLTRYAVEVGADASYTLISGNGKVETPLGHDGTISEPSSKSPQDADKSLSHRRLSDIEPMGVSWLWPDRVAAGKNNLFFGDGGVGKSFALVDIMARISRGTPWPDCQDVPNEAGTVILLNAEDDPNDTIRVRFDAQSGDPSKVYFVDGVKRSKDGNDCGVSLAHDLDVIEQLAVEVRAKLLIIDPATAYTGGKDIFKDDQVRDITTPLKSMAERLDMAVVLVMHTNKSGTTNAKYKAANAAAWINSCRMAWMFAEDPGDPRRRTMTNAKNNLVYNASGLAFSFDEDLGCLKWDAEPVNKSASQVLMELADDGKAGPRREAEAWLLAALADGPMDSKELVAMAKDNGIAARTLQRAKREIGVKSGRDSYGGGWRWELPEECH